MSTSIHDDHDPFNDTIPISTPDSSRPHSIDLSIQLERELDNESNPSSSRPQSLDTHVLASIISQLRASLADITRERDSLSEALAEARAHEDDLKDTVNHVSEKCVRLEGELSAALDKQKEDEDAITMLRSKVEESRRGLMRLQTESRRKSQISTLSLDLSAASAGQPSWASPTPKRTSFAPLTGSPAGRMGHRRISSVSDTALATPSFGMQSGWPASPSEMNRRLEPLPDMEDVEALKKELAAAKEQLEEAKHELIETQEAREASELCVKALRTFISDNSVGMGAPGSSGGTLTRTSTRSSQAEGDAAKGAPSKWGFNFWKVDTSPDAQGRTRADSVTSPASVTTLNTPGGTAAPFAKLGSLFGARASNAATSPPNAMQGKHQVHQEPMFNGSDTSSVADSTPEPISPASVAPRAGHALMFAEEDGAEEKDAYMEVGPHDGYGVEF